MAFAGGALVQIEPHLTLSLTGGPREKEKASILTK